jgi:hypothetical protein
MNQPSVDVPLRPKNPIRYVFFVLYVYYYNDGARSKNYAFTSAAGSFGFLVWMNISGILGIFGIGSRNFAYFFNPQEPRWEQYLSALFLWAVPMMLFVESIMRKELITNYDYDENLAAAAKVLVPAYFIASFILVVAFGRW